jgi:hypothetical protein
MTQKKISELYPGAHNAIDIAYYLSDNEVKFTVVNRGYLFDRVIVQDPRFVSEKLRMHTQSYLTRWMTN